MAKIMTVRPPENLHLWLKDAACEMGIPLNSLTPRRARHRRRISSTSSHGERQRSSSQNIFTREMRYASAGRFRRVHGRHRTAESDTRPK